MGQRLQPRPGRFNCYSVVRTGPRNSSLALNAKTGQTLWENPIPEAKGKADQFKGGWGTPVLHGGQIVLAVPGYVAGIDPKDGKELWRCRGMGDLVYTNPVIGNGVIVAMSGYGGPAIALRLPGPDDRGDLTDSHRLWREEKPPQRIGSGVIAGDYFYLVNEPGIAQCWELKTGRVAWRGRVAGSTWSSSILSGDRIYVTDQTGETIVFRASPAKLEVLHRNELNGETTRASPAVSDGQVFIRTHQNLYCIVGGARDRTCSTERRRTRTRLGRLRPVRPRLRRRAGQEILPDVQQVAHQRHAPQPEDPDHAVLVLPAVACIIMSISRAE